MSLNQWLEEYKKVGKDENYSEMQIELYGQFIEMCIKIRENLK